MKRPIIMMLFCSAALLLGACSTSMTGHVFVDANGNREVDAGEKGIQGVHYTVTQDGKKVGDGYTDATGAYAVKVTGSGQYCIDLDKVSLQGQDPKFKPRLAASALIEGPVPTPLPTPEDAYGGKPQVLPVIKDVPASTPTPPSDSYAKPAPAIPAGPSEGTITLKALSGCVQMGFSSQYVPVPIELDFSKTIESIPKPPAKKLVPGGVYETKISWPASCRLISSPIPDIFMTTSTSTSDVGIVSDPTPMLDFSESIADGTSPARDLTQDGLATKVIQLQVRDNVLGDKTKYIVQQKVSCPDGETYSLPGQELEVTFKSMVSVTQNLSGHTPGVTENNVVTIVNNSQQTIVAAKLMVSIKGLVLKSWSDDVGCTDNNLGDNIACTFDLRPSVPTVVTIHFTLPGKITNKDSTSEKYTIDAVLTTSQSEAITADPITFSLPATP